MDHHDTRYQSPALRGAQHRADGCRVSAAAPSQTGGPGPADPLDGELVLDVRQLVNKLFPACLSALNTIMQHLPLGNVPGCNPRMDNPPRVNLPWQFSDTTGHRLCMLYGITELQ